MRTNPTTQRWQVDFITEHLTVTLRVLADDELEAESNALTIICEEYGRGLADVLERRSRVEAEVVTV